MQTPPPVPELLRLMSKLEADVRDRLRRPGVKWLWRPDPKSWSLTEVVCHLRDVEIEVHQARFQALIRKDNAFISGVSADEWAHERHYREQHGPEALSAFVMARKSTVALLKGLPPTIWERTARHSFLGTTSFHELLSLAVRHDEIHWQQIRDLIDGSR